MFIIQSSSAELQTTGVHVHSFARDYLCQQFWSFCFFPHPSQKGEQQRYQNLALGLKYLFESCQYLFMNWKYKEISLVLFLQTFQAKSVQGLAILSETDTIRKFCIVLSIRRVTRHQYLASHSNTEQMGAFFFQNHMDVLTLQNCNHLEASAVIKDHIHACSVYPVLSRLFKWHTELSISQVPCGNLHICTLTEKCVWGLTILKEGNKNFKLNNISS